MQEKKSIKITWPALILTAIISFLVLYAIIDASVTNPKIKEKIEHVYEDFDSLKVFLDEKIPQIDSALVKHDQQIKRQEEQLEQLHNLTKSIKEN